MGWMNDTLRYSSRSIRFTASTITTKLTFSMIYAFTENFVLPLSHDEVVHGKRSLLEKMPGDDWQKFANLRLLFGYMYAHPGKKLLFMGSELAQRNEFWEDGSRRLVARRLAAASRRSALARGFEPAARHRARAVRSGLSNGTASNGSKRTTRPRA